MMFAEFGRHQVLPLDASVATRLVVRRPSLSAGRNAFTYLGAVTGIPDGARAAVLKHLLHDHGRRRGGRHRDGGRALRRVGRRSFGSGKTLCHACLGKKKTARNAVL